MGQQGDHQSQGQSQGCIHVAIVGAALEVPWRAPRFKPSAKGLMASATILECLMRTPTPLKPQSCPNPTKTWFGSIVR
jgi:hypothetical protein